MLFFFIYKVDTIVLDLMCEGEIIIFVLFFLI